MRLFPLLATSLLMAGCTFVPGPSATALKPEPGDLVIPRIVEPTFDRNISAGEWDAAKLVEGDFYINDGSNVSGHYPFKMWLGADDNAFFIAILFPNITQNPNTRHGPQPEDNVWYPDFVDLFFAPGRSGPLTSPSYWLSTSNAREQGSTTNDGYWTGQSWKVAAHDGLAEKFHFNDGKPTGGTIAFGGYTEDSLYWEIYIPREPANPQHNALDLRHPTAFRLSIAFSRGAPGTGAMSFDNPHDDWPGVGYTPTDHMTGQNWATLYLGF